METGTLRPITEQDLEMVLEWRNRKEVRDNMYTSHVISWDEHLAWFSGLRHDTSREYFIFQLEEHPVGFVGFSQIDRVNKTAEWAFYSGNSSLRGVGTSMEISALNHAFNKLELNKLSCEVLRSNEQVVRFHRKFGFEVEGILKKHKLKNERFQDVYRLAILRDSWLRHVKPKLALNIPEVDFRAGQKFSKSLQVTGDAIRRFAQCSGDLNPIHLDRFAALEAGFKSPIAHGAYINALISQVLGVDFPGAGSIYLKQDIQYLKPVYADSEIGVEFTILSVIGRRLIIENVVRDKEGNMLARGESELLVPNV